MENSKVLYKSFTKLSVEFGVSVGLTLKQTKSFIKKEFVNHPYVEIISTSIDTVKIGEISTNRLLDDCLLVCEEFGPNREYVTLVLLLESVEKHKLAVDKNKHTKYIVKKFRREIDRINKFVPAPPLYNMLLETRSLIEWSSMVCLYPFIPKRKKGGNKPVILIPPYLGNDFSTSFVRKYLNSLGFKAYRWDLGANMIRSSYIPLLEEKLEEVFSKHQEKVSLVGWSGGGIFAKILANRHPDKIEQIITIGAPIWGVMDLSTPINGLLDFLRGKSLKERNKRFLDELEDIPKVPITCIYTKTDGIVPWKHCIEAETYRQDIRNIEVYGSHSGLGANATVLLTIANSLNANLKGKKINVLSNKFDSVFFPKFWRQKGTGKLINLFFK